MVEGWLIGCVMFERGEIFSQIKTYLYSSMANYEGQSFPSGLQEILGLRPSSVLLVARLFSTLNIDSLSSKLGVPTWQRDPLEYELEKLHSC